MQSLTFYFLWFIIGVPISLVCNCLITVIKGYVNTWDRNVESIKLWTGALFNNDIQEYENTIFLNNKTDAPEIHFKGLLFLITSIAPL